MTRFINPDDGLYGYWPTTTPQAYQNNVVPVWHGASPQRYVSPDPTANFYGLGGGGVMLHNDNQGPQPLLSGMYTGQIGAIVSQVPSEPTPPFSREMSVLQGSMIQDAIARGLGGCRDCSMGLGGFLSGLGDPIPPSAQSIIENAQRQYGIETQTERELREARNRNLLLVAGGAAALAAIAVGYILLRKKGR